MNTLKTVQVLSKTGKILSKIVFIFCIIGFCGCIAGILSMALGVQTLKIGGITLKGILQAENISEKGVYAAMAAGMIFCAGEAVLAKFAEHYFRRSFPTALRLHRAAQEK